MEAPWTGENWNAWLLMRWCLELCDIPEAMNATLWQCLSSMNFKDLCVLSTSHQTTDCLVSQAHLAKMRVAIIGQSQFAGEVYKLLQKDGHQIAGVFTIPDVNGRADPLGE